MVQSLLYVYWIFYFVKGTTYMDSSDINMDKKSKAKQTGPKTEEKLDQKKLDFDHNHASQNRNINLQQCTNLG